MPPKQSEKPVTLHVIAPSVAAPSCVGPRWPTIITVICRVSPSRKEEMAIGYARPVTCLTACGSVGAGGRLRCSRAASSSSCAPGSEPPVSDCISEASSAPSLADSAA